MSRPAPVARRLAAAALDLGLVVAPAALVGALAGGGGGVYGWAVGVVLVGLQVALQGKYGWTVAQRLVSLRVVDQTTGLPVGLGRAVQRLVIVAAGGLVGGVGALVVVASGRLDHSGRQRGWHDLLTSTEVIDLRVAEPGDTRSQQFDDAYQNAKAHGASDREAERAGYGAVAQLDAEQHPALGGTTGPSRIPAWGTFVPAPTDTTVSDEMPDVDAQGDVHAQGVILAARPTGQIVASSAVFELQVQVTRPDGTSFQVTTDQPVAHDQLPFAAPGNVVRVSYPLDDEQRAAVGFQVRPRSGGS